MSNVLDEFKSDPLYAMAAKEIDMAIPEDVMPSDKLPIEAVRELMIGSWLRGYRARTDQVN